MPTTTAFRHSTRRRPRGHNISTTRSMECLRDWPEPVVSVQAISDSSARTIPDRYVKPQSDRPSLDHGRADVRIPVVDLASLTDDVAACDAATLVAIAEASREWGFFQAVNHGVSPALLRRVREVWRRFFHLPMAEKQRYKNSPATYEGYGSRLGVEKGAILDWSDYYFLYFLPLSLMSHDKWPALPPTLRDTNDAYGVELIGLCRRVLRALSVGLGLDAGRMAAAFQEEGVCMRVNFYPKCPQPELTMGLSAHSDPGGLTILLVDDHVTGLQVRKDGSWITIRPLPDSFIINIGDQIQVLSNAAYKSVEHRAMVNAHTERMSVAFFYNPKSDITIGPMPELVSADWPALYQPMTFDEYRLSVREKGIHGKSLAA